MDLGANIKRLRLENELTQEELGDRCDLSKGFISQLERNLTSPSIATLIIILNVLGTDLKTFFANTDEGKVVYKKDDVITTDNIDDGNQISWLVTDAQKNDMEPILCSIKPSGVLFDNDAYIGEHFGYVLSGKVMLELGNNTYKVSKGESFYYKANDSHKIYNPFQKEARLIMVSSPPSF